MKKIIIIEALRNFIEQNASVLIRHDNKIFYVKSGKEAIDVHGKEKADLIIAQLEFPDLTCEQLCTLIRENELLKQVSILIVCSDTLSDIERCQKCGANDYITRPLSPAVLLKKIMGLLNVSERTSYSVMVKVSSNEDNYFFCTSQNISVSGILLETDQMLKKGDRILCDFFLPNSVRIYSEGEITRVENKGNNIKEYGVRFIDLSPITESEIKAFIENWKNSKTRFDI